MSVAWGYLRSRLRAASADAHMVHINHLIAPWFVAVGRGCSARKLVYIDVKLEDATRSSALRRTFDISVLNVIWTTVDPRKFNIKTWVWISTSVMKETSGNGRGLDPGPSHLPWIPQMWPGPQQTVSDIQSWTRAEKKNHVSSLSSL